MSVEEVDRYLAQLDDRSRSSLERLRSSILAVVPEVEQGLSYGAPVFRLGGKNVAGFSAAKNHLSYLPHSGDVLAAFSSEELAGFSPSKGALKIPIDTLLPDDLVAKLIAARRSEAGV